MISNATFFSKKLTPPNLPNTFFHRINFNLMSLSMFFALFSLIYDIFYWFVLNSMSGQNFDTFRTKSTSQKQTIQSIARFLLTCCSHFIETTLEPVYQCSNPFYRNELKMANSKIGNQFRMKIDALSTFFDGTIFCIIQCL